jgi:hypothetical protein
MEDFCFGGVENVDNVRRVISLESVLVRVK